MKDCIAVIWVLVGLKIYDWLVVGLVEVVVSIVVGDFDGDGVEFGFVIFKEY